MLSPRDDDDDDSHLCIKCNATILGLDNYIKHRKERCTKSKPQQKVEIPIDSLEPTYNLGADVFFQSLELQSSVKKTSLSRLTPPIPISKASLDRKNVLVVASTSSEIRTMSPVESNFRGGDWIGGHSLRIGINEDNQTKLINAVASISGTVKKEIPTSSYSIGPFNDYKIESDESEDSEDEDDEEPPTGGKWKPPPNYTGGKWRPASPEHEEWVIRDEQEHTGGKWRPIIADDRDEDYDAPPPGHTKGKWVPGAHEKSQIMQTTIQMKGSVQYWCGPCNRRLGSRAIYEKHLMSKLHMKKVLPENELEFSGHLQPFRSTIEQSSRKLRSTNKPETSQKSLLKTETEKKKKRKRKLRFVNCPGCKSRVRQHLMGKHLISHYHFRKASTVQSQVYRQLILNNIDVIVHQSPFQCSPCKFYTNWLPNFMRHWSSEEHSQITSSMDGRHWCSFCKFECETSMDMLLHLSGAEHSEVVAVINRSMPIIIRKKSILKCETCYREFRYNAEIRQHCQLTGHQLTYSATDEYQELHTCLDCAVKFKSSLSLAAHLKSVHKQKTHLCLVCSRTFCSADEAKRHRNSSEHRLRRRANMKERGLPVREVSKKCPYCIEKKVVLDNVLELKDHIRRMHPNNKKKCPKCGMSFILPQEVTRHIRSNACQFRNWLAPTSSPKLWNCSQCLFTTDSQAECFFHEVLHTVPVKEVHRIDDKEKILLKYRCPLCPKNFRKSSLRFHLRQHTCERPFICRLCGANFTRKSSLVNHQKDHETPKVVNEETQCRRCRKKFNAHELTSHSCQAATELLCAYEKCGYVASTPKQYAKHYATHGERLKHLSCPKCPYRTDQSSHLKRHLICHETRKPYKCPHCEFTCASLENLRKHALRRVHRGLPLYLCARAGCSCGADTAAGLRVHRGLPLYLCARAGCSCGADTAAGLRVHRGLPLYLCARAGCSCGADTAAGLRVHRGLPLYLCARAGCSCGADTAAGLRVHRGLPLYLCARAGCSCGADTAAGLRVHRGLPLYLCARAGCSCGADTAAGLRVHRGLPLYLCARAGCSCGADTAAGLRVHRGLPLYLCARAGCSCGADTAAGLRVHRGLPLYLCARAGCSCGADTAAGLRAHLVAAHPDTFDARSAVEAVKRHLMIE